MAERKITIYDVAEKSGVSPATVSRVLNEPDKVAADKKSRVLEAIKELDFVPKAAAVVAARKLYKKICVVAPFFGQSSFMERLRGIESVLDNMRFEIVIYSIQNGEDLKSYIRTITTTNFTDGLILLSLRPDADSMELLRKARFPVCFVENFVDGFDNVVIQNDTGGWKAGEYLYAKGCRRPAFVGEKSDKSHNVPATDDRLRGFRSFFSEKNIDIPEERICVGEFMEGGFDGKINSFLDGGNLPDCVFCSSDLVAVKFVSMAVSKGIKIPEEMKVLGFDDIDISKYMGLSSVSQSLDESGKMAAECVLNRLRNGGKSNFSVMVPINVVERKTT